MNKYRSRITLEVVHNAEDGDQAFRQSKSLVERMRRAINDGVMVDSVTHYASTSRHDETVTGTVGNQISLWEPTQ